ncbi:MAG: hypothetical protein QHI48_12630, partial [Bacteroidota bacterium]|nr:hypothetical protein [Bacteroidota bacterium]
MDPPDLVPMAAGVARAYGKLDVDVPGMFYPYSPDLGAPNLSDTCWMNWMERDAKGGVRWKQLIQQKVNNYEGFTFIDTAAEHYTLKTTDRCLGTVPQPHREFIAVLSLGGEEIDMNNPTPEKSPYSNLEYTTIFGEKRNTPIRTTYTYYAPLPNPLQFEYITNNFMITDYNTGSVLRHLPAYGKANLTFEIDASTEYSYYWIRNAGHDVDFNDPSEAVEGVEELGDGVFGYMIYDIPKGMGGYKITLPKRGDGSYDIDKIVSIDGGPYHPWLKNRNTRDSISILEDAFAYHVFIPQILIPPALDDDNNDGVDDWIDDRGDRFQSKTGFLHDAFMLGNGESYPDEPKVPFKDDIYGWVTSGWSAGPDGTYGDDFFEKLGRTHVTIHAVYEGTGREGCVDVSKGGWLVVEEIFGGSPWVLFSHDLTAYAEGVNYALTSSANPTMARYGEDTVYIKHIVEDRGEPHVFDAQFDPFQISYGNGVTTLTTYTGGKDPCNLISPAVNFPAIIDPRVNHQNALVLIPNADPTNPDLAGYPKTVGGSFLQVRVEVSNGTEWNWINTRITPVIPPELGSTKQVMSYVSYPRPLVPAQVDPATGKVIRGGDDPTAFRAGWRFNQPEGEVLIKLGNRLPLLQAARRAYFVFLFSIDESLPKGVYRIDFAIDGDIRDIDGARKGSVDVAVPSCMFSIAPRDARGNVVEYQKLVIGTGRLDEIRTAMVKSTMTGLERVRWSKTDIAYTDFDTLRNTLPASYNALTGVETIDLSPLGTFPTVGLVRVYLLEQARVSSFSTADKLPVTTGESLLYTCEPGGKGTKTASALNVSTLGPKIILFKTVAEVNGVRVDDTTIVHLGQGRPPDVAVLLEVTNQGASIAEQTTLLVPSGPYFAPDAGLLPPQCSVRDGVTEISCGPLLPGETRRLTLHYDVADAACARLYDSCTVVRGMTATYIGTYSVSG